MDQFPINLAYMGRADAEGTTDSTRAPLEAVTFGDSLWNLTVGPNSCAVLSDDLRLAPQTRPEDALPFVLAAVAHRADSPDEAQPTE